MRTASLLIATLAALAAATPVAGRVAVPITPSKSDPAIAPLPVGLSRLRGDALAYRPRGNVRGLLILLHGAGQAPADMIDRLRPLADARGLVLVGVKSVGDTWDVTASIRAAAGPLGMKVRAKPRLGRDPARIGAALDSVRQRLPTPLPVAIAGFSDGASEALSVGLADPRRYRAIIAMSPGLVLLPATGVRSQPIVITHGRSDGVLSFAVSKRDIAGLLERVGYRPTFIAFDGDHRIDLSSLGLALDAVFGRGAP
jgi:phospholipase/carboxylesterase